MNTTEIFAIQQSIIDLQSKAIDKLFISLMQHSSFDDECLPDCVECINKAARLKAMLDQ